MPTTWKILGETVLGASHSSSGKPNQDAIGWEPKAPTSSAPLVMALADGHGSERFFRSADGARFAVEVTLQELHRFARESQRLTDQQQLERQIKALLASITRQWRERVLDHWVQHDLTREENLWLKNPKNTSVAKLHVDNPALFYGATLLAALVTEAFILYFQIGDGDILSISPSGKVTRPIPEDTRNIANETTSLCAPAAEKDFRASLQWRAERFPALIMLSTDGYSNCYQSDDDFFLVGSNIWKTIREQGVEEAERSLKGWLETATRAGSGDDISVGLLCRESALKEQEVEASPEVSQTQNPPPPQHAMPEELTEMPSPPARPHLDPAVVRHIADIKTVLMPPRENQPPKGQAQAPELSHTPLADAALSGSLPVPLDPVRRSKLEPHVITVDQSGKKGFRTIKEAVEHAASGDSIHISPGTYHLEETLVLDKDIELRGEGNAGEIKVTGHVPCLRISALVKIWNIHWFGTVQPGKTLGRHAIEIAQDAPQFEYCEIITESSLGILVHGREARPMFYFCKIWRCSDQGIIVTDRAMGTLESCVIAENQGVGITFEAGSFGRMTNCRLLDNKRASIEVQQESNIRIEYSEIKGLVVVETKGQITFHHCGISDKVQEKSGGKAFRDR